MASANKRVLLGLVLLQLVIIEVCAAPVKPTQATLSENLKMASDQHQVDASPTPGSVVDKVDDDEEPAELMMMNLEGGKLENELRRNDNKQEEEEELPGLPASTCY